MDNELKPCPFCGGSARYIYTRDKVTVFYSIRCDNCFATMDRGCHKDNERRHLFDQELKEAWNKRSGK